jgi:hypothetical protein
VRKEKPLSALAVASVSFVASSGFLAASTAAFCSYPLTIEQLHQRSLPGPAPLPYFWLTCLNDDTSDSVGYDRCAV